MAMKLFASAFGISRLSFSFFVVFLLKEAPSRCLGLLHTGLGSHDEVRLVDALMQGYNPLIRPVRNLSDKVLIKFGLAMIQLINVDEKNQIMKSNVWLRMLWNDYQLQWEPTDYGGINVIRVLSHKVWKPDIVLFNNADGKYEVSYKPNVVVYNTGDVLWIPPAIYKSSCTIDVQYFPFDQQECHMKFGSWTFNGDQVVLDWYEGHEKVDLSDYVNSGTWDIIGCPGVYNYTFDRIENHHKAQITFTLRIRRKTLFYTVNLIIPCVLISFLSVCVFYLPADAGEKMTMCISILLALVVFLLLVSKILPPTSITIPLIAKYLLFTFIMNIITIVITVVIINWNFKTPRTHRMPRWIRVVFLNWLPRILIMKRPQHSERWCKKAYSKRAWRSQSRGSLTERQGDEDGRKDASPKNRVNDVGMIGVPTMGVLVESNQVSPLQYPENQNRWQLQQQRWSLQQLQQQNRNRDYFLENRLYIQQKALQRSQQQLALQHGIEHDIQHGSEQLQHFPNACNQTASANNQQVQFNWQLQDRGCSQPRNHTRSLIGGEDGRGGGGDGTFVRNRTTTHGMGATLETIIDDPAVMTSSERGCTPPWVTTSTTDGGHDDNSKNKSVPMITPETSKAIEAVRFIAAHLKNEDEYGEILEDWRYIAMVIDRLQLYIFLAVTVVGTASILMHAPHIFEFVDQDEIKRRLMSSGDPNAYL